ncbi:MAG: TetR/AcrR family transcriptional regulator [Geodermatophilaceae bacterium]|nr:TetR/AcrR family transcriptional regulator [Geodermatophilaceae bacterium]
MDAQIPPVKSRAYRSPVRKAQAAGTRQRIIAAATRRFLAAGYAATAMSAVAGDAGVSVPTVYKGFGNKALLAQAVVDAALAGDESVPAPERATQMARHEPDPRRRLRAFGDFVAEVAPRVAPLMLLIRSAAETAPELVGLWEQANDDRLASMTRHARQLAADGHLRAGVSVAEAADVLWAYTAPELYDLLVNRRRWSSLRFADWVAEAYIAALLEPG